MLTNSPRLLFYSVGRTGIGQTSRAFRVAEYVTDALGSDSSALVVTGVPFADQLFRSPGCSVVSPPEVIRLVNRIRQQSSAERQLGVVASASKALRSLVKVYSPDVFVTTSHRGVAGELLSVLPQLRQHRCRTVLALRDIYDPPQYVRDFDRLSPVTFDSVLVGGPTAIRQWLPHGLVHGPLAHRMLYGGYLVPPTRSSARTDQRESALSVLCQVGGGGDGKTLVEAVIAAAREVRSALSRELRLYISTGPLMPTSDVDVLRAQAHGLTFVQRWWSRGTGPDALEHQAPHLVVSMAGYSSCVEAAWSRIPSILVPRSDPGDCEQQVRAGLFAQWFPNVKVVDDASAGVLAEAIASALVRDASDQQEPGSDQPIDVFARPRQVASFVLGRELA